LILSYEGVKAVDLASTSWNRRGDGSAEAL
jgi:hypothetical protein